MSSPNRYALTVVRRPRRCTCCRIEVSAGLIAATRPPRGPQKALCDVCILRCCEPLGLALRGLRLMRQAAAYTLADPTVSRRMAEDLVGFAVHFEERTRNAWPRLQPAARIDCEHCLIDAFPDLDSTEADVLRRAFRHFQRMRFDAQSMHDIYFLRHHEFCQVSEDLKIAALDHLESFFTLTDPKALCPLSCAFLNAVDADALQLAS